MFAAAAGKSTLGIPRAVGEEFVGKDAAEARPLYVRRSLLNTREFLAWAILQGFDETLKADDLHVTVAYSNEPVDWDRFKPRENTAVAILGPRSVEELGDKGAVCLLFQSDELAERHRTFEDGGASWDWPQYRPHVTITYFGAGVDLTKVAPYDGPLEFGPEVFEEIDDNWLDRVKGAQDCIALDRATVRSIDADGHLHVERTPISKAVVNPYYGREVPDFERLGLDPEHIYRLYRDPKELARAASSFEGKPLLIRHKPVNADDHPKELTVGTIGSPVSFDAPYLTAPLTVWDGKAIELIETDEQRELSAGYRYRPDMTPGTTPDGEAFDGTMRDIGGNHLALVEQGRAGPDVLVQDSALTPRPMENITMATSPKAKARAARVAAFKTALDGKLAADANIDEVIKTLIAQDEMEPRGEDEEHEDKKAEDEEEDEKAKGAKDDGEEVAEDEDDEDDKEEKVSKSAMDEAIRTSAEAVEKRVRKQFNDIRIAEDEVRPYVGKIAVACDSADKVYRHALDAMKIDIAGLHPSAYRSLLKALPVPSTSAAPVTTAMDAAAQDAYSQRFPNAGRLK
ncbi:DUF2213 domain-containing protein [Rhizobiales bacterium 3FA27D7]|jgi:hypothetical protein|uniref:DUF2213 domain-containing protein n=1 Tax=Mesorhizobium sp. 2RAF21 TaxID=3232995 RepID=UPI0010F49E5C